MPKITAPWLQSDASQRICRLLTDAGHQVFFVGGCVRNALLDAPVSDLDLATDAIPTVVQALAKAAGIKCIPTGIDHGTLTLIVDDIPFEITTFRSDLETDGRHATIAFSTSVEHDARRRDFTMNALYADPDGNVLDPVGGLPDLRARRVVFIDDANQRIKEDYLRILRFFRFHAWYGDASSGLDRDCLAACAEHVDGIDTLSKERIGHEMIKLLGAPDPAPSVSAMAHSNALMRVLPGADANSLAILVHIEGEYGLAADPIRRLAVLGGQDVMENLRMSKADYRRLKVLQSNDDALTLGYRYGSNAIDILAVRAARMGVDLAQSDIDDAGLGLDQTCPVAAVDLIHRYQGAALGVALRDIETAWIASRFSLTKEQLLATPDDHRG